MPAAQPVKIALLQMTSGIEPAANAVTLVDAVAEAVSAGASMLFAPEMSAIVDRDRERAAAHIGYEADSPFIENACAAARTHGLWLHLGSLPVLGDDNKWRNRSLVIDKEGHIRARYDKIHLFDVDLPTGESWRESSAYEPGTRPVIVDSPVGRLGLTICYDVRFAGLYDSLGAAGADVIAAPAAFTVPTGLAHWHLLLRARAIDQGCFIIAAAQCGTHEDGRSTYGHSLVVDPWGEVLLDMGSEPGLGYAEIDMTRIGDVRTHLPVLHHRKPIGMVKMKDLGPK